MNKVGKRADRNTHISNTAGAAGRHRPGTARICALGLLLSCMGSSWIMAEEPKQTTLADSTSGVKAETQAPKLSGLDEFVHSGEVAIEAEKAAAEKAAQEAAALLETQTDQEIAAEAENEAYQETELQPEAGTGSEAEAGDGSGAEEAAQTGEETVALSGTETEEAAAEALETEALALLDGILCFDKIAVTVEKNNPAGRRLQTVVWNTEGEALPGRVLIRVSPLDGDGEPVVYALSENTKGVAKSLVDLSSMDGSHFKTELYIAETEEAAIEAEAAQDEAATEAETVVEEVVTEAEIAAEEVTIEAETAAEEAVTEAEAAAEEAVTEAETATEEAATEVEVSEAAVDAAVTETEENEEKAGTEAETGLETETGTEESEALGEPASEEQLDGAQLLGAYRFELKNAGQDLYLSAGTDGALCTASAEDRAINFDAISSVALTVYKEDPKEAGAVVYEASPDAASGMWTAPILADDLKGAGTYQVQARFSYQDGAECTLTETAQFHAAFEEFGNLKCTKISRKKNILKYRIYDIDPIYADTDLKVALWQQEDQSDLNWYEAERRPDGSYRLQAQADAYAADYEQIHTGTLFVDEMHSTAEPPEEGLSFARPDILINAAGETITASNIPGIAGSLKEVRFEVWGEENGQNDLHWYRAQEEDGTYKAVVPFKDRIEIGTYQARMWMYYEDGTVLAGTQTQMTLQPEVSARIRVKKKGQAPGTAQVVVKSLQAKEPVSKVIARVYNEGDLQRAHWYEAEQKENGSWTFRVDASYHGLSEDDYSAQLFAVTRLGRRIPIGETGFKLKKTNPQILLTRRGRSPFYDVKAEGFPAAGVSLDGMTFLISSAKEPDKVLAKTEADIEGGLITGTIKMNEVGDVGDYIVRAQAEYRNASVYQLGENTLHYTRVPFTKAAKVLDQIGWDLMAAFRWSAGMTYYGHNGIMPEDDLPGIHWFANYGFDNYQGNCYVMAATFYEMAVDLGYSGRQIAGGVGLRVGGIGPHSWVELDLEDGTWVFDPNFTNESGGNGFKIHYTDPGTWSYTMGDPMKLYDQRD